MQPQPEPVQHFLQLSAGLLGPLFRGAEDHQIIGVTDSGHYAGLSARRVAVPERRYRVPCQLNRFAVVRSKMPPVVSE